MADPASKAELMRSLGRLVRGLSALFWGLPLTLLVSVQTAMADWLKNYAMIPPLLATGLLFYGLLQLSYFQKQERIWRQALDRAIILALVNLGLSPFLFWWNKLPQVGFYSLALALLMLTGLLFLFNLNYVLQRLAAMLPDETLKVETHVFTTLNLYLLCSIIALVALYLALSQVNALPDWAIDMLKTLELSKQWLLIFLILLPIATTMTLIWKIKEVIFTSVFGQD